MNLKRNLFNGTKEIYKACYEVVWIEQRRSKRKKTWFKKKAQKSTSLIHTVWDTVPYSRLSRKQNDIILVCLLLSSLNIFPICRNSRQYFFVGSNTSFVCFCSNKIMSEFKIFEIVRIFLAIEWYCCTCKACFFEEKNDNHNSKLQSMACLDYGKFIQKLYKEI